MRALIQRVSSASVTINGDSCREIGEGLVILLGITHSDSPGDVAYLAEKCANLRIFNDDAGKMNRSLLDIQGEALVVSQFTLYSDCRKGRRPSFVEAARPEQAIPLYEAFLAGIGELGIPVTSGEFGASMLVDIKNSGPVTIMVESQ